ncbi:NAD(P)/FAD-dependent oxidoreductase [Streptomyces sp. NPDC058657]|uniref:NAD(P)/FAD-dependent oxidoreductase n=1 Tax=unclassified Streptomyces TaxID=2593676 RepID=UPI003651BC91
MTHHLVVLGAGYAGMIAAKGAARRLRRADVRVTLVNAAEHFVERVRVHQLAAGGQLAELPLAGLLAGTGIELVVGRVTAIDADARTVRVDTGGRTVRVDTGARTGCADTGALAAPHAAADGTRATHRTLTYDTLVYALGSAADRDTVPGVAAYALSVATYQDAVRLRERTAEGHGTVAVAGGGATGLEVATELAESRPGLKVRLVTDGEIGTALSERARRHLRRALHRHGVELREHSRVSEVSEHGLVLADGSTLAADAVVWTTGFRVPELARDAGLKVDARGLVVVDRMLRSVSHPEVFAAGDAAAAYGPGGMPSRLSCQTALPMGLCVARNVAASVTGGTARPLRLRYVGQNIGLGRHDGLTQVTRFDDSPREVVLTGRVAALLKEAVTRATVLAVRR